MSEDIKILSNVPRFEYKIPPNGITDEEVEEMIRMVNEKPLCIQPLESKENKAVLEWKGVSGYWQDFVGILVSNGYTVTVRRIQDKAVEVSWEDLYKAEKLI